MQTKIDSYIKKWEREGYPVAVTRAVANGTPLWLAVMAYHYEGKRLQHV